MLAVKQLASMKLHSEGHRSAASLILDVSVSPNKASTVKKNSIPQEDISYSPQEFMYRNEINPTPV